MTCTCTNRSKGDRHDPECPARRQDTRTARTRPDRTPEKTAALNARRITGCTDCAPLREAVARLCRAPLAVQEAAAEACERILSNVPRGQP
jgi:hypothetical protein